jgi:uncharacterized membrane protein YtjA (UPF0391 family)
MLRLALFFLIFALIAALFGFGYLADTSAWIAQVLCFAFLIMFLVSLLFGTAWRSPPAPPV